ncbi:MAG: site-specific DNA-methyltransferase [Bacteroidetes bacterium]|nr:MAG: site-specific DNA-methyltransferase [Bacteroidota bacterium]
MSKRSTMKSFGVAAREGHNSDAFYARKLYTKNKTLQMKSYDEQTLDGSALDTIFCRDSRNMSQLPDCSVHLMVTSPPYNVGKDYDKNLSLAEYRKLLRDVFTETYRVLVPGGRACINIANLGRKPYIPLHTYIIEEMESIGYLMRGEIIWDKSASAGVSTAWGSWKSASNPILRDVHEYILIFSKESFAREKKEKKDSITKEQFMEYTKSVWKFPAESAKRVKHPAPFPVELPSRLIQLYTFEGDVVLDPFAGSGTTCVAAIRSGRHFVGYDTNKTYVKIAKQRTSSEQSVLQL